MFFRNFVVMETKGDELRKRVKALFFDIDGTLVSFQTHTVPASTVEALTAARQRGVGIYIATGRPWQFINNLAPIAHLIDGYMTTNGAYCYAGDRTLCLKPIPHEAVLKMKKMADRKGFACIFMSTKGVAIVNANEKMQRVMDGILGLTEIVTLTTFEEAVSHPVLEITPFITPDEEASVLQQMPGCQVLRWHHDFADITLATADKGKGLAEMAKAEGFEAEEAMAFGDGGNDVAILKAAGIGVAMGNAADEVKAQADYVTDSVDDDGISHALRHFGII